MRVVALDGGQTVASADGAVDRALDLSIAKPKLWSPDTPFLYDLRVELRRGDEAVDRVRSYFGMRKVAVGPDARGVTRLLLNGKPLLAKPVLLLPPTAHARRQE